MNKRAMKKRSTGVRKDLHRILDYVLDINGMQVSSKERTGDHPTAFLEISGHIAGVSVDIHRDGWYPGSVPKGFESRFDGRYFAGQPTIAEVADKLRTIRTELTK